jgi:hypothetical protein
VIPFTRIMSLLMAAVLCFMLLLPMSLKQHNTPLSIGIVAVFALYLCANVLLWRRMKPRA